VSDQELAREMVNMPRSTRSVALALLEASTDLGGTRADDIGKVVAALAAHDGEIDGLALPDLMVGLASLFAAKTGSAPKQIWEQLWKDAPTDAWWRDQLNRREEHDG
jgi:hypothetical protein